MSSEGRLTFFRQSGWLVVSTVICGVFLIAVYSVVQKIPDLGTFLSMLRLFTVLGIVTSGLQVVMAQEAASALTTDAQAQLALSARSVARGIFFFWLAIVLACVVSKSWLLETLKIDRPATLAVTLGLVLAQLFLPFVQGLLQGGQKFGWLGWSIIFNGAGRFFAILILTAVFHGDATIALAGALIGLAAAVLAGGWPSRKLIFSAPHGRFQWGDWAARALPLSAGTGAVLFLMNADVLFVQAHFTGDQTAYYGAVAIVGVGLVTFTTPMAAVMFPKLVRSAAQAQPSNSLLLALSGTAILGICGALVCTVWPSLPLRILYYKTPKLWESARLVPWFMWSMLPLTLANVLVGGLLARRNFQPVPWFVAMAVGYGLELNRYLNSSTGMEMFAAFKGVILRLGIFSGLILIVALIFSASSLKRAG